jgi:uncharacterized membrane protein (DUF4010 family)
MEPFPDALWLRLAVALGVGLLIGAERERRKGEGTVRAPAGIRTFTVVSLLGAVSFELGGEILLAVAALAVAGFAAIGYRNTSRDDPGMTSEATLLLTALLGALAMHEPAIASGLAVAVAGLLAARTRIHHFVRSVLTEAELHDALILAAAALVILPLTPDRYMGPFAALNPRTLWAIVVLMLAIGAAGYVALRVLGPRYGLAVAGLASGFVSSAATIGAMGSRARERPELMPAAVAGAVLSTVATMLQMTLVLAASSTDALAVMAPPLACAGGMAVIYGGVFTLRALSSASPQTVDAGRAFRLGTAVALAATMALVSLAAATLDAWLGRAGLVAGAAVAGFADTHSPAVSVATLVAGGKIEPAEALLPIMLAMSTNTATKIAMATTSGGLRFAAQVVPGLLLTLAAAWVGTLL